jgi:hypothetical protein
MNIYEFCEKFRISLRKARKMDKAGVLRLDSGESEHGAEIRQQLRKGQPLTVAHFLYIIEEPTILSELCPYDEKAKNQLAALGDVNDEAAPREVAAYITDAARGDDEAIGILVGWLKGKIPAEAVTHHWVAIRLLMGLAANIRGYDVPRIQRALLNCRKSPDFTGWWRVETIRSRQVTFYQRSEIAFDL